MTTRALNLRSHPGQASLPGGKADHTDGCVERTALRESEEEIGLAQSKLGTTLFWVHTGTPFISKTCLLVHPVIFLLIDPEETLPSLVPCPTEVSAMWSFPLELFLSSCIPAEYSNIPLSDPTTVDTHRAPQEVFRTYSDVPWINSEPYRLHRFRTHRQLIKGLSADILIAAAMRTYGRAAAYTLYAPGQPPWQAWVDYIVAGDRSTRVTRWGDGESGDMLTSAHAYATAVGVDDAVPQQAVTANDTAAPRSEDLVNGTEIAIVESS
ncbi:hypothetical protein K437DRAFT_243884 [Tilletiaria anomala UBC 951]|uniref:Nudix hydrolase domain-containing protein n=1 Tax=Tilletiaria anomala (strain ATCC 24038 / CBS 436.72 / UBC 951) TaxID=1037660 RepID=A0A066WN35_TILAU|nr:uncharacterized protein K437DRAFT_243884 [Tilletiaria anomala UBC 951]KDN52384.1 hypothetical protein K437DRAFT_243884 [Tilletiaria anomala UBC 951]